MTDARFDPNTLRAKRKARGLSLAALGRILGVSHQAVSRWEQGHTVPSTDLLPRLATALHCRIDDLFTPAVGATA
jgi:transcriptional regulator with XRE-family HTH domain